ncbi:MAG: hypothetical protein MJE68_17480, partial [Proteobacteria bacterium]|nr:hypothetical protein [Pseudomonadota bacterium]
RSNPCILRKQRISFHESTIDVPIGRNVHAEHCVGDETVKRSWKLINYGVICWNQICSQWITFQGNLS